MQQIANNLRAFNSCLINQGCALRVRWNGHTGRYILRQGDRKVIASRYWDDIENEAEKRTANAVIRLPVAA